MIVEYHPNEDKDYSFSLTVDFFKENPFAKTLLYLECGQVVGYLTYFEIYDKMELANIEVAESYRGK